jgi:hypothetical protein
MIIQRRGFLTSLAGFLLLPFAARGKPRLRTYTTTPDQVGWYWFEGTYYGKELDDPVFVGIKRHDGTQRLVSMLQHKKGTLELGALSPSLCVDPESYLEGTYTELENPNEA